MTFQSGQKVNVEEFLHISDQSIMPLFAIVAEKLDECLEGYGEDDGLSQCQNYFLFAIMTYDILLHLAYLFDPCEIQRHLNNPLNSGRRVPIICIFFFKI